MALPPKRILKKQELPGVAKEVKLCGGCNLGKEVDDFFYRNVEGEFIMLVCPFEKFKILKSKKACDKWEAKK